MQAVIIAGGKGTRLRPLTLQQPKPLLPLLEVPFLAWMVGRCQQAGLTDILLNVGYLGEQIEAHFQTGEAWGVRIRYIRESDPLDTAGAMLLARPYFTGEPLVVFNADILTDLDLRDLMAWHQQSGAVATLTLTRVADITAYGLVETDPDHRILSFREKPSAEEALTITTNTINAGTYVLDPKIFDDYLAGEPLSFERKVFPSILSATQPMSAYIHTGYWRDLGNPSSYYQGQLDILLSQLTTYPLPNCQQLKPGVWVHTKAQVDPQAHLAAPCYIGSHTTLGSKAHIPAGTIVNGHCWINRPLAPGVYGSGTLATD